MSSIPMPLSAAELRALAPSPRAAARPPESQQVEFTASGGEYFRIWIVNLALLLLTLGLYYPWAKVRKLRYFYRNTMVAGHGLDFHGNPRRMLRGYLLMTGLFALYSLAGKVSPLAASAALVALVALWPALFRASLQFRLANTSWRGLRLRFTGDLRGAYAALLPVTLPPLVLVAASLLFADGTKPGPAAAVLIIAAALAWALALPWGVWRTKRYLHGHCALGRSRTTFGAGVGSFYALGGLCLLIGLGVLAVLALLAAVGSGVSVLAGKRHMLSLVPLALTLAAYAAFGVVVRPYWTSRLQNLAWSATALPPLLRVESRLPFAPLARLAAKNLLLTLVTLGLYWPFAAVAVARMRVEAVSVLMPQGADGFVASARPATQDAAGEAAGDLFDIDVGF